MDTSEKGELIQKEKKSLYNIQRKISLYLVIVCVVFIMLFIYVLINMILSDDTDDVTLLLSGLIVMLIAGFFLGYLPFKNRMRCEIYQNGFIPNRRPYNLRTRKKEPFIPWNDVVSLEKNIVFNNPKKWFYNVRVENWKPQYYLLAYTFFNDGGPKVLERLEEIAAALQ